MKLFAVLTWLVVAIARDAIVIWILLAVFNSGVQLGSLFSRLDGFSGFFAKFATAKI
jgi:hypothetical protein